MDTCKEIVRKRARILIQSSPLNCLGFGILFFLLVVMPACFHLLNYNSVPSKGPGHLLIEIWRSVAVGKRVEDIPNVIRRYSDLVWQHVCLFVRGTVAISFFCFFGNENVVRSRCGLWRIFVMHGLFICFWPNWPGCGPCCCGWQSRRTGLSEALENRVIIHETVIMKRLRTSTRNKWFLCMTIFTKSLLNVITKTYKVNVEAKPG